MDFPQLAKACATVMKFFGHKLKDIAFLLGKGNCSDNFSINGTLVVNKKNESNKR